jgi:hypothetical protein
MFVANKNPQEQSILEDFNYFILFASSFFISSISESLTSDFFIGNA